MTVPRVVLDTNIVLSALVFARGRLVAVRHAWQRQLCLPLISNVTTHELIRVLAYPKFRLSAPDQEGLLSDYLPWCSAVQIPLDQSLLRSSAIHTISVIRDPHDLAFLELALAGKADYLVSGDADLHAVAGQFPIPIITAEAFLGLLVSSAG